MSRGRGARLGVVWSWQQEATSKAADKQGGGARKRFGVGRGLLNSNSLTTGCLINVSEQSVVNVNSKERENSDE